MEITYDFPVDESFREFCKMLKLPLLDSSEEGFNGLCAIAAKREGYHLNSLMEDSLGAWSILLQNTAIETILKRGGIRLEDLNPILGEKDLYPRIWEKLSLWIERMAIERLADFSEDDCKKYLTIFEKIFGYFKAELSSFTTSPIEVEKYLWVTDFPKIMEIFVDKFDSKFSSLWWENSHLTQILFELYDLTEISLGVEEEYGELLPYFLEIESKKHGLENLTLDLQLSIVRGF